MAYELEVDYYNSFWIKKVERTAGSGSGANNWPGLPWNPNFLNSSGVAVSYPTFPFGGGTVSNSDATVGYPWYVEEARIKGGFNNNIVSLGVRAYTVDENVNLTNRSNSLIFSGVFNDRTGYNETNVFSVGEPIVRDADPINGSIQRLYTENTNLIIFQENKVSNALLSKSTVYSGEQGAEELLGTPRTIGQLVPYLGEYGISRNPESFGQFGYRKYFADRNRSAILRLSRDGITEISSYGMRDYFRDYLALIPEDFTNFLVEKVGVTGGPGKVFSFTVNSTTCCDIEIGSSMQFVIAATGAITTPASIVTDVAVSGGGTTCTITVDVAIDNPGQYDKVYFVTQRRGKVVGGFDVHNQNYVVSMQKSPRSVSTTTDSYSTVSFDEAINGWISFYDYKPILVDSLKNKYYSFVDSNIYEHYYQNPTETNVGVFYGVSHEASISFIFNPNPSIVKNFSTVAYEGSNGWEVDFFMSDYEGIDPDVSSSPFTYNDNNQYRDTTAPIRSYDEGVYTQNGVSLHAGFSRKENRYVANLVSSSPVRPGEIIFGNQMSGIKGYIANVKFSTDGSTDVGGIKELFAVSSRFVPSSY